ncbi:hypothetical protein YC2023_012250 [Brassica napus]
MNLGKRDDGSDGERDGGSDGERDGGSERREKKDHDGGEERDDRLNVYTRRFEDRSVMWNSHLCVGDYFERKWIYSGRLDFG